MIIIRLENISKYYHNENTVTLGLRKISLSFNKGEFVALTGESGSGKSTLLNVISGIDSYEEGELFIDGEETSYYDDKDWEEYRKNKVGFIFQNYNLIDSYSVIQNVEAALIIQGIPKLERIKKAKEIINEVGLTTRINHKASKLSGGEKQRLSIARALAKNTEIIVADEPTGNLDSVSGKIVLELLKKLSKDKLVIVVTHNYEQAEPYVTRKVRLFDGEVVEDKEIAPYIESTIKPEQSKNKINLIKQSFIFALKNLTSKPRKSIFLFLVTFTTIFFTLAIYSSYSYNANIERTNNENMFYNDFPERVIVSKKIVNDKIVEMTEEDKLYFNSLNDVKRISEYDPILEYRVELINESKDYFYFNFFKGLFKMRFSEDFSEKDLLVGRLPVNDNEILISSSGIMLYDEEKQLFYDKVSENGYKVLLNNYMISTEKHTPVTIVGVIESNRNDIYLHNDFFKLIWQQYNTNGHLFRVSYNGSQISFSFQKDMVKILPSLKKDEIILSKFLEESISFNSNNPKIYVDTYEFNIIQRPIEYDDELYKIYISQEIYDEIFNIKIYQYTLILNNPKNANNVVSILRSKGYNAIHPASLKVIPQYNVDGIGTLLRMIFETFMLIIIFFAIYIFSYLIIRTILFSSKKDYSILRTIGISINSIKLITLFEILLTNIITYLLTVVLLNSLYNLDIAIVTNIVDSLEFKDYIIVFIVNILIGFLISRRYLRLLKKKSIFGNLKVGD